MDSHGCLCCRYIVVSTCGERFPPPRVLCPMVGRLGNASAPSMRRLSTVQTGGGKCAPIGSTSQCRSISSRRSSCSAPCSSNDCTRTLPRLLRMRSRELVVLILHYTFQGKAFSSRRAFPPLLSPRQVHATGGEKIVEAMQPGESPRVWGRQPRYRPVWHEIVCPPPAGLLCEKRARVNTFEIV